MALNATPGDPAANSYTDVAYADAYFVDRLHVDSWNGLDNVSKESLLIWATRLLETEDWRGIIASGTQALRHPRTELYDADGRALPFDVVIDPIQQGCCEYALILGEEDTTRNSGLEGFNSIQVDVISLGINSSQAGARARALPDNVARLINGYIKGKDFGLSAGYQRVELCR